MARRRFDEGRPPGRNLTHGLLDSLGRQIVRGDFDAAVFPTEAELARQHDVSRSVTREAVKMLTAKGLLSARPRHGTVVQPPATWSLFDPDVLAWLMERRLSVELLRHFNELRIAIEPEAAALAARFGTATEHTAIAHGWNRMAAAETGHGDPLAADIAFHVAVLGASANPFYRQFRDVVASALQTSIRVTNRVAGRTASLADHAAVRDAILRRDATGAREAMRALIADVITLIDATAPDATEIGISRSGLSEA